MPISVQYDIRRQAKYGEWIIKCTTSLGGENNVENGTGLRLDIKAGEAERQGQGRAEN